MKTATKLDEFTRAYIETALWSSTDNDEQPLDANYGASDIAPESLVRMVADCSRFQAENAGSLAPENCLRYGPDYGPVGNAGHNFWLTRNGHGAGFWDGDWGEVGDALTEASHRFGEVDLYVGDDGLIHQS